MPFYGTTITGNENIRTYLTNSKYELNFYEHQLSEAVKLKIAHSSHNNTKYGWRSWRLYNKDNDKIAEITQYGY